jgi:cell division protein FtsL
LANVNDEKCESRMAAQERTLGREIGLVRKDARDAKDCAQKKVEKTNFRWTVGIVISVIGGILLVLFLYSVSNGKAVSETKTTVAGMEEKVAATKEKVDGLERDHREWRTEQRTLNESTQRKLDEIKDLVKNGR